MSIRQLTRQNTHFLVRYECDNKTQVRSRGFFRTDDEILVDGTYTVQWGRKDESDTAVVLAAGTEAEMKAACRRQKKGATTKATPLPKKTAGRPPAKVIRVASPPGFYPETTVVYSDESVSVTTTSPVTLDVEGTSRMTTTTTTSPVSPEVRTTMTTTTTTMSPVTPEVTMTPTTTTTSPVEDVHPSTTETVDSLSSPVSGVTGTAATSTPKPQGFLCRPGRPSGFGPLQSNLASVASTMRTFAANYKKLRKLVETVVVKQEAFERQLDRQMSLLEILARESEEAKISRRSEQVPRPVSEPLDEDLEVPAEYRIPLEELRVVHMSTSSSGNMAAHLVKRLFPELFGVSNLRTRYSWNGAGHCRKLELCPVRKQAIRENVCFFYPEVRCSKMWQAVVVPKVNELLRRVGRDERKAKKENVSNPPLSDRTNLSGMLPNISCGPDLLAYMDL